MSRETSLIFYPGHLGPIGPDGPTSELRTRGRAVRWDQEVRAVPEPDATDLVVHGGFHRALTVREAAAHYGLTQKRLGELAKGTHVTTAEYQPGGDAKPETVIVLDRETRARLRQEVTPATDAPADGEES